MINERSSLTDFEGAFSKQPGSIVNLFLSAHVFSILFGLAALALAKVSNDQELKSLERLMILSVVRVRVRPCQVRWQPIIATRMA